MPKDFWISQGEKSKSLEINMNPLARKRTGSYYTDLELTDIMMQELVENLKGGNKKLIEYRFLEPCVGTGNFVFSYIKAVKNTGINNDEARIMLNNIYVADINTEALDVYKDSLRRVANLFWGIKLSDKYFNRHIGTGLLVNVTAKKLQYIALDDIFPAEIIENGFDIVATNPPYKKLKAERDQYVSDKEYDLDKEKYSSISKIVKKHFKFSAGGILNLYKLFVEEIIDQYTNGEAYVSLLIPTSIMSDKTCTKLRRHMLTDTQVISIKMFGENSRYIDAHQALSAVLIKKGSSTQTVNIAKYYDSNPDITANVSINDILNSSTGDAIIAVSAAEYKILKKLRKLPIVKDLEFIVNLRGELDLTIHKKEITGNNTGYPLLVGKNIGYYEISADQEKYVSKDFVYTTKKRCYIKQERIACQQIANMNKNRRITFALIPRNHVLGNSCNFIAVNKNKYGIDIYTLLGLFNTKIINWFFKLTSSNNHVNNYEIDSFPIPIEAPELRIISKLARKYLEEKNPEIINEIEKLAKSAYKIILPRRTVNG